MRTLVIGDIHGGYKALLQCLERSKFDKEKDQLISLGDICDGWSQVREVFDELLSIKNLVFVIGNHDYWTLCWMNSGEKPLVWVSQGGQHTLESYGNNPENVPSEHRILLQTGNVCYVDEQNRLFVHGGIDPTKKIEKQDVHEVMWDRDLLKNARHKHNQKPNFKYGGFKEIYIGHTSLTMYGKKVPTRFCNVWGMDTGGGWEGKLSIMDIDSKEHWQSDYVSSLYLNEVPR